MICPKCKCEGVRNQVFGVEFWYCRTCKDEIYQEPKPTDTDSNGNIWGSGTAPIYYAPPARMKWSTSNGTPIDVIDADDLAYYRQLGSDLAKEVITSSFDPLKKLITDGKLKVGAK
jgi:hypothetical protein